MVSVEDGYNDGGGVQYIDGLVQDFSNSIANALESLQSCTKPSKYGDKCDDDTNEQIILIVYIIDLIYKFHNALVPYPTVHHSEQKCAFLLWMVVHCGIWNRGILGYVRSVYWLSPVI